MNLVRCPKCGSWTQGKPGQRCDFCAGGKRNDEEEEPMF